MTRVYYKVSDYYKETYKEKVYKLPIKLPLTCPNRDGACGYGGCIYCSETGGSFENLDRVSRLVNNYQKIRNILLINIRQINLLPIFKTSPIPI